MSFAVTARSSCTDTLICGTKTVAVVSGSSTSVPISAIARLPSGRRFVLVPCAKSLPVPLKSFDCFDCVVQVAIDSSASVVTATSAETHSPGFSANGRAERDDVRPRRDVEACSTAAERS